MTASGAITEEDEQAARPTKPANPDPVHRICPESDRHGDPEIPVREERGSVAGGFRCLRRRAAISAAGPAAGCWRSDPVSSLRGGDCSDRDGGHDGDGDPE